MLKRRNNRSALKQHHTHVTQAQREAISSSFLSRSLLLWTAILSLPVILISLYSIPFSFWRKEFVLPTPLATIKQPQNNVSSLLLRKLQPLQPPFDVLKSLLFPQQTTTTTTTRHVLESAVVDLRHCSLEKIDYTNFTKWAQYIFDEGSIRFQSKVIDGIGINDEDWNQTVRPELILGLLEIFATHHNVCDFSKLQLNIPNVDYSTHAAFIQRIPQKPTDQLARLVFVIVAFHDCDHLLRLVEAIHMPHHLIIIHLERSAPPDYVREVHTKIVTMYNNVVVLQFGAIMYRTDSVSMINYQIMNWLIHHVTSFKYDYHISLGGAVFPLYGAKELATHLASMSSTNGTTPPRHVWLGELTHAGAQVRVPQYGPLQTKRLLTTYPNKYTQPIKRKISEAQGIFYPTLPDFITTNMVYKTNSGNQAVFAYSVVQQMVTSAQVKQLFAIAKYGCCCCLEERTWIAAMFILGYGDEALQQANMWQLWGGETDCTSSMSNAVLSTSETICFRLEDATQGSIVLNKTMEHLRDSLKNSKAVYIRGNQMMQMLKDAKQRGFMFARKFRSDDAHSLELLLRIKNEIHNDNRK